MKTIYNIERHYNGRELEYLEIKVNKYDDFGRAYTYRENIEITDHDGDAFKYYNNFDYKTRRAAIRLCRWARGLHGNAPTGTQYGSARFILHDGTRVSFPVYIGDEF